MNTINITIENTVMHPDSVVAGYAGDNLTTTLSIELPDSWSGYSYRLLFKTSMQDYNDAYITDTIQPEGGHILFPLPSAVMVEGKLQVQARAEKDSGEIAHAAVMSLDVLHSIGTSASGDFPPSYVGLMDNALNHLLSLGAWYPPKIVDGYWWAYDATADDYANTGVNAQGLNSVTEETETALTGILKGNGAKVTTAVAGTDYATPAQLEGKLDKTGGTLLGMLNAAGGLSIGVTDSLLKTTPGGVVNNAIADTDYATPGYVNGQISAHDSASGAHADLFDAKLDKTGGTINGGLTAAGGIVLPIDGEKMLKTASNGKISAATAGTDYEKVTFGGTTTRGYAKFASGLLICWGKQNFGSQAVTNPWGTLYESSRLTFTNFAYTFSAVPVVTAMPNEESSASFFVEGMSGTTTTSPGYFYADRPNSATIGTTCASYIAIGRWKS